MDPDEGTSSPPSPPTLPDVSLLDKLRSHIALLDDQCRVIWVNQAWNRFGTDNQAVTDSRGLSYQAVCESARGPGAADADAMLQGLDAIRRDALDSFTRAYDCSSPQEHRIFQAQLAPAVIDGRRVLILTHDNITRAVDSSQTRARLEAMNDPANPAAVASVMGDMLTHELSAPLTALICTLAGVRHLIDTPGADPVLLRSILAEAAAHADLARATTAALRTLTAQTTPGPVLSDLSDIAAVVAEAIAEDARARSVRIETVLDPAPAETDPARAVLLLMSIARRALQEAGRHPITNRLVRIRTGCAHTAWVRIDTPVPTPGHSLTIESCAAEQSPFGPDFAARTAADLGGTLTVQFGSILLELPPAQRRAA